MCCGAMRSRRRACLSARPRKMDQRPLGPEGWPPHNPLACTSALSGWRRWRRDPGESGVSNLPPREALMDQPILRLLIQEKLADGRLPHDPDPARVGRPGPRGDVRRLRGDRDQRPDGDGKSGRRGDGGVQLHVACFHVWDVERQIPGREPSVRLPARSGFRAPDARPGRPWAPSAPAARPSSSRPHDARVGKRGESRGGGTRGAGPAAGLPWTLRRRPSCQKPAIGCARPAATAPSSDWVPSRPARRGFGAPTAAPRAPRSSSSSSRCGG